MKFTLALSTLAVLLAVSIADAAPQGTVPRLQPAKVAPQNGAALKTFGDNGGAAKVRFCGAFLN